MEFPDSIGPFSVVVARLAGAINAFYRHNPSIPRPDPASSESTMVGMDPPRAGIGHGEVVFGQLSPLHTITLDGESKAAASIPAAATTFAWAYPLVLQPGQQRPTDAADCAFVDYGGYVYFDDIGDVVGTHAIQPAPLGTPGLTFGRVQLLPRSITGVLTRQGRFQEVTLQALADKGATHFAWIRPNEFHQELASFDGCFAYKFANSAPRYFPIVSEPVFTEELLGRKLGEFEAWAVVRAALPSIERISVFDKRKTLEDNIGQELGRKLSGVQVRKEDSAAS